MSIRTTRYADMGLERPVAIVGFPGTGLVSSIVPNYFASQLEMQAIAGMSSPEMPPYCLITNGKALPPVRFYGHKGTGIKTARDVIVCMSEYSPKPEHCYDLCMSILDYLRKMGCEDVVCLEGTPRYTEEEVLAVCASGPNAAKMVRRSKLTQMEGGMIRGTTGVLMYAGPSYGMTVTTLLCPASQNMPDPGSAAKLIQPVCKLIPGLKVNTKQLLEEAEQIQKKIDEAAAEKQESTTPYYG